jgi:hypothetical protein
MGSSIHKILNSNLAFYFINRNIAINKLKWV